MADTAESSSAVQNREREGFLKDLHQFHDSRGTPFINPPQINGQYIDLHLLYTLVTARGGWIKVNNRNEWDELLQELKIPNRCVNVSVALKQVYLRYLDRYEKVHFLGDEAERGSDDDVDSRHRRWSARALHTVPLAYNHHQHNVSDTNRDLHNMSCDLYHPSNYDKIVLSLTSPLPNEQDFAINVCTLLSNDTKNPLKMSKCPRLLDLLLAHAGVFNHISLRELITEVYNNVRGHSLDRFWKDTFKGSMELHDLTDERLFDAKIVSKQQICESSSFSKEVNANLFASDVSSENNINGSITPNIENNSDADLFCTGRTLGMQDYIGQRILQVAYILRNLSFNEENTSLLAKNKTFVRFLLLCANSHWNNLQIMGYDMLGNIANDIKLNDPSADFLTDCLMNTLTQGLCSQDRAVIMGCLEILNKLSQNEENEVVMLHCLDQKIYEQVCMFLNLQDIMLLIYTLECLYSITCLGERANNNIVRVRGVIDTLVALVTVEAQTYGPKACILMRVVETLSNPVPSQTMNTQASTSQQYIQQDHVPLAEPLQPNKIIHNNSINNSPSFPEHVTMSMPQPTQVFNVISSNINPSTSNAVSNVVTSQPVHIVTQAAVSSVSLQHSTNTTQPIQSFASMQSSVQMQHAHQQAIQENEQFALAWLRSTFEPDNSNVEQQELYRLYINSCSKIGRKGVISPLHFPRCVRSVFGGSVGPNPVKENNETVYYYNGIRLRNMSLLGHTKQVYMNRQASLKTSSLALENNMKSSTNDDNQVSESPTITHPHLSQALLADQAKSQQPHDLNATENNINATSSPTMQQNKTSFIKSLLAKKITENNSAGAQLQKILLEQKDNKPNVTSQINKPALPKNKVVKAVNKSNVNGSPNPVTQPMDVDPETLITSTTIVLDGRRAGTWDPPPPLAPLSSGGVLVVKVPKTDEDSNSNASSSVTHIRDAAAEENENSYEGVILNGNALNADGNLNNDDSNSKDSMQSNCSYKVSANKMLAELLDKKSTRMPVKTDVNNINKDKQIIENENFLLNNHDNSVMDADTFSLKRCATNDDNNLDAKRNKIEDSTDCIQNNTESSSSQMSNDMDSNEDRINVSSTAANLYAALAADALEDEEIDEIPINEIPKPVQNVENPIVSNNDTINSTKEGSLPQPNIIITQNSSMPVGNQVKPIPQKQQTIPVIMHPGQNIIQGSGHFVMSGPTGQMQIVSAGQNNNMIAAPQVISAQGGQIMLSGAVQGQTYVMPQNALLPGQGQTLFVTQTPQQQGTCSKTIIILQPQMTTAGQKVVMTPQGQQVVMTKTAHVQNVQIPIEQKFVPVSVADTTNGVIVNDTKDGIIKIENRAQTPDASNINTANKIQNKPKSEEDESLASWPWVCDWAGCTKRKFNTANQVYRHVCDVHCPQGNVEALCQWGSCDNLLRRRFSLMTHMYDKHCSAEMLKASVLKRKQQPNQPVVAKVNCAPPPQPAVMSSNFPAYAPNAAMHAIKRHALEYVNPKELLHGGPSTSARSFAASSETLDSNEGPVTKSIRLTASLILRNIVIYSRTGRRYLRYYEPHLASVALSNVESSRTIAQVLYDLNDAQSPNAR